MRRSPPAAPATADRLELMQTFIRIVDAGFKDLPDTIKRGDDLEVRVSVPDNATCRGELRFDDGGDHFERGWIPARHVA